MGGLSFSFYRKENAMKIIAGLGNPGAEYAGTRHNAGFMLVDALAAHLGVTNWREKFDALVAEARIGAEKVLLVKPQTYMNDSGRAIGPILHFYKLPVEDLIVCHDDMDIPCGTIRIRKKGSAGGHNGIKSILAAVGDEHFPRVRIGIGRPKPGWTVVNHVLSRFEGEDAVAVKEAITHLIPAVACIVTDGPDLAMNRYNPKKQKHHAKKEKEADSHGEAPKPSEA